MFVNAGSRAGRSAGVIAAQIARLGLATAADVYAAANKLFTIDLIKSASAPVTIAETGAAPALSLANLDWNKFINGDVTLTANRAVSNPMNGQPRTYRTILIQGNDATDRTVTFGNQFLGDLPTITDCDSTKWYDLTIKCITATHFTVVAHVAKKP